MMNHLLYIGENPIKIKNGGDWINKRNILVLQQIYEADFSIYDVKYENKFVTFTNLLMNYMSGLSITTTSLILEKIKEDKITAVFLASSRYGKIAKIIKRKFPYITIYIFFHNIEKHYISENCRVNPSWKNRMISSVIAYNERMSCLYGDYFIVLNQRDQLLLKSYYNIESTFLLPTTFIDKYDPTKKRTIDFEHTFTILFVGFAFFANIEGVTWFIENICPALRNYRLQIVGSGMDTKFTSSNNIEVHGFVDDLADFYYNADLVILPIFSGGGMKTKTAEALMYGCPIVGTKEAFEGYELDYERVGGVANTKEEMIDRIETLQMNLDKRIEAGKYARTIFEQKYEFSRTVEILKNRML